MNSLSRSSRLTSRANRRRLRREKPQRHAATIISPTAAHRKDRAATTPQFATNSNRRPNPDFIAVARVNGLLGAGRAITAQEVADELDVTLGALAVTEQQLARALNVSSYTSPRPLP